MSRRTYIQNVFETTLAGAVGAGDTSLPLSTVTNLRFPGHVSLNPDSNTKREIISYATISGSNIQGCVRGLAGSAAGAQSHDSGTVVRVTMYHQVVDDLFSDVEDLETDVAGHVGGTDTADHPEVTPSTRGFMTAADKTYLNAVNTLLPGPNATNILSALLTVDGAGSGLDADLLDGNQAAAFGAASDVATLLSDVATLQAQVASLALSRVVAGSNTAHTDTTVSATSPSFTTVASVALTPPSHWDSYTIVMMGRARTATNAVSPYSRLVRGSTVIAGGESHINTNGDDSTLDRFAAQSGITAGIGSSQTFAYQLAKVGGGDPNFTAFEPSLSVVLLGAWTP